MKIEYVDKGSCSLCGGGTELVEIEWGKPDIEPMLMCAACRDELMKQMQAVEKEAPQCSEDGYPSLTAAIAAEAAGMTEEEFDEKYLTDTIDRVVFEFVRGYGRLELDGQAMTMMVLMLENVSEEEISKHMSSLVERGIIYKVQGKKDWYGADYPFSDDI